MEPIAANPAAPETERLYPIRTVAQLTQVNPITLRAWERRYNLIRPIRTPAGHRLYSDDDIRRIREILDLSEQGIGLAQIAAILNQRTVTATSTTHSTGQQHSRPLQERSLQTPTPHPGERDSWSIRLEKAVRNMDSTEVTRIEQEALLWLSPGQLFDSVLLPVLNRLEQPDATENQELARHWFSDRLRTRLHNMQEGRQTHPSGSNTLHIAVEQLDGPRPLTTAEFHLLLKLDHLMLVRLAPLTLNRTQTAELISAWKPSAWLRLVPPNAAGTDTIQEALLGEQASCPDTMIMPCTLHSDDDVPGDVTGDDSGKLLRGTADHCSRRIFERLRRR